MPKIIFFPHFIYVYCIITIHVSLTRIFIKFYIIYVCVCSSMNFDFIEYL